MPAGAMTAEEWHQDLPQTEQRPLVTSSSAGQPAEYHKEGEVGVAQAQVNVLC